MLAESGADIAFCGVIGRHAELAGNITESDLFNALPYDDTLCVLKLARDDAIAIIEEQRAAAKRGADTLTWSGISIKRSPGGSVQLFLQNGEEWKPNSKKRFDAVFSSYDLASAGGRYPKLAEIAKKTECHPRDTGIPIRDAVRHLLQRNGRSRN